MSPLILFFPLYFLGIFIKSKSKKAGAIYNLCWTCGLLIFAFWVISNGGQLTLWNVELPNAVIVILLLAVMASEIFDLVRVMKEPSPEQVVAKLNDEAPPEGTEALEDGQSVELILDRPPRFVANGVMNRIVFNGKEYGMLGNGKEMTLTTRQLHNRLEVFVGFKSAVYEFDAVVGERHLITVENTLSDVLLHVESPAAAEISSKK